jgi:hypothetical protein
VKLGLLLAVRPVLVRGDAEPRDRFAAGKAPELWVAREAPGELTLFRVRISFRAGQRASGRSCAAGARRWHHGSRRRFTATHLGLVDPDNIGPGRRRTGRDGWYLGAGDDRRVAMPATVIVGLQRGDEGKGHTTDLLFERVSTAVRYHGDEHAGTARSHTMGASSLSAGGRWVAGSRRTVRSQRASRLGRTRQSARSPGREPAGARGR